MVGKNTGDEINTAYAIELIDRFFPVTYLPIPYLGYRITFISHCEANI